MRVLGWVLFAATCFLFVLQGILLAAANLSMMSYEVLVDHVFPLLGIGAIIGAGVGALIVSFYPRNLIGWLLLVGQLGNVIGLAADAFGVMAAQGLAESSPAGLIAGYLSEVFGTFFAVDVMSVIFMISPDGRPLSRRWRPAVGVPIAALTMWWAAIIASPGAAGPPAAGEPPQEFRQALSELLVLTSFFATLLSIILGAVVLVLRMRRSTGEQRLQLRWISTGAAVLAGTFVAFALFELVPTDTPWVLSIATCLAYILFSVCVGVAIFRYRLYGIDVILSRGIVLAVLAVFVTAGYVLVVVGIGTVLVAVGAPGSTSYWPSLVATALVAVAFQPLRRRVLHLADQLVYGSQAAPYEALAALSQRLADSPSPDDLPARVAEAAGRSVGAAGVVVRLGDPGRPASFRSAAWPDPTTGAAPGRNGDPALVLPVRDMGDQVGSVEVTMPANRQLRPFERDLLNDFATQAGVAFRNILLETELAARVRQIGARSAELEASRRRLVGAEDEAREQLAGAIRLRVVPHLDAVDTALSTGFETVPPAAAGLEPLITRTECALEELRTVCRGVFPALLTRRGLVPALTAQLDITHPLALLDIDPAAERRLDPDVEAAGYLFCVEVAPRDRRCMIQLRVDDDQLIASVASDDAGWPADADGTMDALPWQHSRDRVAALDGLVALRRDGSGAAVIAVIPLHPG